MSVSSKLAWRYLIGRPGRTALTTLAIVFGVSLIFGLNGMLPGIIQTFQRAMLASAGQVDLAVTSSSGGTFEPGIVDRVARIDGVAAVSPSIRRSVSMPSDSALSNITLVGIEPRTAVRVHDFSLESGRMLNAGDTGDVVLGADTASDLEVGIGGSFAIPTVSGLRQMTVVGLLTAGATVGNPEVYVTLPDAQRMLGAQGRVSAVEARFVPGADRARVEAVVRRELGSDYTVGGLSNESSLLATLKVGQFAISMFGIFALVMGGFIILNTFRTLVSERRHDIGMLRAIGAERRTILGIFLIQSLLQGVLGTGIGILTGYGIGVAAAAGYEYMFREILHMDAQVTAQFGPGLWATAILLGIGITVLGAVLPARQAARITPLEALRPQIAEVVERERSMWVSVGWVMLVVCVPLMLLRQPWSVGLGAVFALSGLVMIAPALIKPLAEGMSRIITPVAPATADLASSNVVRQPGRAAATASAILVSLAVVIALVGVLTSTFAGFYEYLDQSLGSDFILLPAGLILGGGNVGVDQNLVDRVAATRGVGPVATLRLGSSRVNGAQLQVVGIDPKEYPKVASFTYSGGTRSTDLGRLGEGRTVLVNGIYAAQNAVAIGDRLTFETPSGRRYYEVAGIASDYLNAKLSTVYISQDNLAEDFGVRTNVLVLANAEPGAAIPTVKAGLARMLRDYPQFVLYDSVSFKKSQVDLINSEMPFLYGLLGIFALPTLLALLNTLAISVLARTREIGMLRAVGTTRRQIRWMVVAEALLLGAVGIVFGVAGGIALGWALVYAMNSTGFVVPYYFPWGGIVTAVIAGFAFALLASVVPARTAAKLDVVTALHWE
ncbi:MAG: hypothetical protein C0418_01770 [Coriobacteriaceae bacterium]|nr:hypothetical protein [Coriobacteriaceae bacterium]